jgi:hypothetical protein
MDFTTEDVRYWRRPKMPSSISVRPTRFKELGYRSDGRNLWRFYDITGDREAAVGPHYVSKDELLGDLERYAREYGCE